MTASRKTLGSFGEKYVQAHLARSGYRITDTNLRLSGGEIDVVAWEGPTLVFLEIRTRRGNRLGTPEESITSRKAGKLRSLAHLYVQEREAAGVQWRIDVVAVEIDPLGRVSRLDILKNAVEDSA